MKLVQIKPIFEELCCPICFNAIKDCYMTPCGHNVSLLNVITIVVNLNRNFDIFKFCANCIFECINRKHSCPCCNHATTRDKLVKNHHFDRLLSIFNSTFSPQYFTTLLLPSTLLQTPLLFSLHSLTYKSTCKSTQR